MEETESQQRIATCVGFFRNFNGDPAKAIAASSSTNSMHNVPSHPSVTRATLIPRSRKKRHVHHQKIMPRPNLFHQESLGTTLMPSQWFTTCKTQKLTLTSLQRNSLASIMAGTNITSPCTIATVAPIFTPPSE